MDEVEPDGPPRLVATDLDGTLVHSDGTVTARTRAVLERLEARGVPVVFVTGRPLRWTVEVFEHVGEHGLAVVSNGGLVWNVHERRVELERTIAPVTGLEVARRLRAAVPGSAFAVETVAGIALEPAFLERHPIPEGSRRGRIEEIFDAPALKLLARHEELGPLDYWLRAEAAAGDLAEFTWSSDTTLLEISAAGVTKASTLALVCARLGVDRRHVVAFGDMPNDLPMMEWAGRSYAMANAHRTVLDAADAVVPSNDDDGVAATLEALFVG
ncbi:HAD family hydrolase [Nocardioides sp.]|uniref:HAD family hydrolase n=1 Tax=Nocardioides sp. TaxID=35761 RepID=UPI003529003A